MTGSAYTNKEDDIIKNWYPKEGLPGAVIKLQMAGYKRTINSVRQRASILKVKSPYCMVNITPSRPAKPYSWLPKWELNYDQASYLIGQGTRVTDACKIVGIERSMFYRMRKIKEGK